MKRPVDRDTPEAILAGFAARMSAGAGPSGAPALPPPDIGAVLADLDIRPVARGTVLVRPGEVAKDCYFVLKGCLRLYFLDAGGAEHSTEFFTEEDALTILEGYRHGRPSPYGVEAVEDCLLITGDRRREDALKQRHPSLHGVIQQAMEQEIAKRQDAQARFRALSPPERYLDLLERRPGLAARVPQHQLASYLGVTPESLSRIKKRLHDARRA
jgi:CRP-like cAMP-binding protein